MWQIIRASREFEKGADRVVEKLAEIASVSPHEIQTALAYYRDYSEEIDAWIRRVDEESERAYEEWKREQAPAST